MGQVGSSRRRIPVFRHEKRPQWGLAVLSWEGEDKRKFLFEDGQVRTIKLEYCGLMKEVEEIPDESEEAVATLMEQVGDDPPMPTPIKVEQVAPVQEEETTPTFDEQVRWFRQEYPDGFHDPDWEDLIREADQPGSKREASIAKAAEVLSREGLSGLTATKSRAALVSVLETLDLVDPEAVQALAKKRGKSVTALAKAMEALLHGRGSYRPRFDNWVEALTTCLGDAPSWELATAPHALLDPQTHALVHPGTMGTQARWFDPRLVIPDTPNGKIYERVQELTRMVHGALRKAGQKPKDLLDTGDFVRTSLEAAAS